MKVKNLKEASSLDYLRNAREILRNARREGEVYVDVKYIQEVCGVAYLGVLRAIDEYLLEKGVGLSKLPKSVKFYRDALRRYLSLKDRKLLRSFERIYDELHIAGYYRGFLRGVGTVNEVIKADEDLVKKLKR